LLYVKKPSMASTREFKEKRVEAAAKLAASDLEESNREREYEERAKMEREESQ
jgi:predicted DNA-binding WGR domain protein